MAEQTQSLYIFDDNLGRLGPVSALCAAFQIRTGAITTRERLEYSLGLPVSGLWAPKRLYGVLNEAFPGIPVNPETRSHGEGLWVNGRWAGLRFNPQVRSLTVNQALVQSDGQVVAVRLNEQDASRFIDGGFSLLPDHINSLRLRERALIERPWHILDDLPSNLNADLEASGLPLLKTGAYPGVIMVGNNPVKASERTRLFPGVVLDAEQGPIVIEQGATIHPLAVLQGPCWIGSDSTIMPHTLIRPCTVIGPMCKIGGEVSASVFQGFSNKSHDGFIGDSLIGAWVNLGAGTTTSNLKNTYGCVRVRLDEQSQEQDTGRKFFGAILGDYVRTAIGTRLPTGAVIHPGCMLAASGWAPKFASANRFITDDGCVSADPDRQVQALRKMTQRRGVTLSDATVSLVRALK